MWGRAVVAREEAESARVEAEHSRERADSARVDAERSRARADTEKVLTLRNLFSSLMIGLGGSQPGSICVVHSCGAPKDADSAAWLVLARVPEEIQVASPPPISRDWIASREFGKGKVLVYAHDGITHDSVLRDVGSDVRAANVNVVENAIRWLAPMTPRAGCDTSTTTSVALWQHYVNEQHHSRMLEFIRRRGWSVMPTDPARLERDLRCAGVLWFGNVWYPPTDFVTTYVPMIERFVREGGGLLIAGLGWSFESLEKGKPYPANQLGESFGFRFTLDAFVPETTLPFFPLLSARDLGRIR
jgi:hypothetical protein